MSFSCSTRLKEMRITLKAPCRQSLEMDKSHFALEIPAQDYFRLQEIVFKCPKKVVASEFDCELPTSIVSYISEGKTPI